MKKKVKEYKNKWALVLGGGGGKGAYQIGVWKMLLETGMYQEVGAISGSSIGALNLVLLAYNNYSIAYEIWYNIKSSQFFELDLTKIDFKQGLSGREGLLEILDNYINLEKISKSDKELFVTATKCNKAGKDCDEIEYFTLNGKTPKQIKEILLASSALPYIYEPVDIKGGVYRDGGLKDNLPIKPLYDAGYRKFIIVPLSQVAQVDLAKYPYATFFTIAPSKNLGNLISGTLDFSKEGSRERLLLGYQDAINLLNI